MTSFLKSLLAPYPVLFILVGVALAWCWLKSPELRRRFWLAIGPYLALYYWCWPAAAYLAQGSLEWSYPPQSKRPPGAAIVVLSGYVEPANEIVPEPELSQDTLRRCCHAIRLYRRTGPCAIVVTGGKVDRTKPDPAMAVSMRDFLVEHGVGAGDILLEDRARNTFENAQFTAELLRGEGIEQVVLVTDAMHLPRAIRCFQAQGLDVTPSGADYGATGFEPGVSVFLPSPTAAGRNQKALHEWLGIAWYWMNGRFEKS